MNELRKYNEKYEDALKQINACLDANRRYYQRLHVRCVSYLAADGAWRNLLCLARVQPTRKSSPVPESQRYRGVHLLEEFRDLPIGIAYLVREMPTGKITIDGEPILVGDRSEFHAWELLPSGNDYSDLPGYLFQSSNQSTTSMQPLQEPLLDSAHLHYPDTYHAIEDWIGLSQFHYHSDARIGYVYLFMPECRGRIKKFESAGGRLKVTIENGAHDSDREFLLKGSWKTPRGLSHISSPIAKTTLDVKIEIPDNATGVDLYLMDQTGTIFDWHQETPFWSMGQERILPSSHSEEDELLETKAERGRDTSAARNRVFIVHGHDETNLLRLDKMLRDRFGIEPVILRYKPGRGRTLIEKFEEEAQSCSFAFILMSPDDQVKVRDESGTAEEYAQARPNVIFETGWFYARLGRKNVCILAKRGTRLHSDLGGISRVRFDKNVERNLQEIESELMAAGLVGRSQPLISFRKRPKR